MGCQKTETRINFLECLATDFSIYIMGFLDDPADLVRVGAVSRLWRQFVIANGLAKQLFLKKFPQLFSIAGVVMASEDTNLVEVDTDNALEWKNLEIDHVVYASLLQAITKSKVYPKDCIVNAVSASSTDNYPDEGVINTLNPKEIFAMRASYWSSKGQRNPEVPEMLIYKLRAGLWVVTEIDVRPFEAFFQEGKPIYSAKSVRFRMGHPKSPGEIGNDLQDLPLREPADDKFVWTYTSPEFPMNQGKYIQTFKLPEPVLCIGGYLQIELLGRVQRQESDGLFYIRVRFVRAMARPLFPAFDLETFEPNGKICLKYYPANLKTVMRDTWRSQVDLLRYLDRQMMWDRIGLLVEDASRRI